MQIESFVKNPQHLQTADKTDRHNWNCFKNDLVNVRFNCDIIMLQIQKGALAKVSDLNSFRINQNYSDSFRYLYLSQYGSFLITFCISFDEKQSKINPT